MLPRLRPALVVARRSERDERPDAGAGAVPGQVPRDVGRDLLRLDMEGDDGLGCGDGVGVGVEGA